MGSGCLSPAPAKGEIDIEALDNMYQDIQQSKLPGADCPYQTVQVYPIIKDKIMKKGQLRKLIDYLSSHRYKICDNLHHSFRIMTQSKTIHSKYVCLLIMNQLFSSLQSPTKNNLQTQNTTVRTNQSQSLIQDLKKRFNNSQVLGMKNSMTNEKEQQTLPPSVMLCQITSYKFQGIYFNIICHLLKLTLQNINKYCKLGYAFFNSEQQIQQIMKVLLYHIQLDDYLPESINTYSVILKRVKQSFFNKNISFLRQFIIVWLNNQVQQAQPQENVTVKEDICINCEQIISNFIKKSIEGWNSCVIYQIIFQLLDQEYFKNVQKIQNLIKIVTQQLDLNLQFYRELVLHLLAYTSMPQSKQLQKVWQSIYPSQNIESMKRRYPKILQIKTKINSLNTINKWIFGNKFVDINDLVQYSSLSLVYSFITNLFSKSSQVKERAILQYISLYKNLRRKQKLMILDTTLQQAQQDFIKDQQVFTMLTISQKFIQKQTFVQLSENYSHIILPLKLKYRFENNVKVIELVYTIVQKLTIPYFYCQLQNLSAFMYSFYIQIKQGESTTREKLVMIKLFKKFIQALKLKKQSNIAIAFVQKISRQKKNEKRTFYNDLISYQILQIIQNSKTMPQNLKDLLNRIQNCSQMQKKRILQTYVGQQNNNQDIILNQDDNYLTTVNILRKMFSNEEDLQTKSIFMEIKSINTTNSMKEDIKQDKQFDDVIDIVNCK